MATVKKAAKKTAKPKKTTKTPKTVAPQETPPAPAAPTAGILAWEDDPFALSTPAPVEASPIRRPVPNLATGTLRAKINGAAPPAKEYSPGTAQFRYWTAADALKRGLDFWSAILPNGMKWFKTVGAALPVDLDEGVDLNAYYDRRGLVFFHGSAGGRTVFSGESP